MGLSGLVGAGAAEGLEEILTRQLLQQQQAERERAQRAQEAAQSRRMDQDDSRHADVMGLRGREFAQRDDERRERSNRAGKADMDSQRAYMDKQDGAAKLEAELKQWLPTAPNRVRQQHQANKFGITGTTDEDFASPEEREAEGESKAAQIGREAEARAAAEARHRAPSGGGGSAEWVIGADGQQHHRVPQQGDKKYEKPSPGAGGGSDYATERADRTIAAVDALIPKATAWTTGMGSTLKSIPATDARAFDAQLKTLTSNIAFNELAQMRDASKTGGALGAVSEREMDLLSSTLGAVDAGQDRQNVVEQLKQIKGSVQRWKDAKALHEGGGGRGVDAQMPAHKVGDVVTVKGQRVRISRVNPDGTFEGAPQ